MSVKSKPNGQNEAPAGSDGYGNDLPEGWTFSKLGDLAAFINGDRGKNYPSKGAFVEIGIPFINAGHLGDGLIDSTEMNYISEERFRLLGSGKIESEDILYCLRGSLGKAAIVRGIDRGAIASSLVIIRPFAHKLSQFLYYFLVSPLGKDEILKYDNGSAQPNLSAKSVQGYVVPVPPLAEQRRIVGKLELLLGKVSSSHQRLSRVSGLLKRFRQSVLAAACSGKLTADWREENDPEDTQWPEEIRRTLELFVSEGDASSDAADIDAVTDVPLSWVTVRLGSVVENLEQGWSPKCEVQPSSSPDTWGVMKTTAVQPMAFNGEENKRLPDSLKPRDQFELRGGDILITRAGPRVRAGVCCLVRSVRPRLILCDKAYRFRAIDQLATPEFIELALNAPAMVRAIDRLKTGTSESGMNLTQSKFLLLLIGLPPLSEQQEIVRRVEKLFAFADQIESRLRQAQAHVDRLTQSLLAKAFRGELVPTEAELAAAAGRSYEPAAVLLARIRAEHTKETIATPSRRRTKTTKTTID